MTDIKSNPDVHDVRDLVLEAIQNWESDGFTPIAIDDTQIALIDANAGDVWLLTVQAATLEVKT